MKRPSTPKHVYDAVDEERMEGERWHHALRRILMEAGYIQPEKPEAVAP